MKTKEFALILNQIADDIKNKFEDAEIEPTEIETWQHLGILYFRVPFSWSEDVRQYRTYKFEAKDEE